MLSRERSESLDSFLVLSHSEISLHDTVADIGCGPGFFTVPLAKFLVNGTVYALDIDDEMLSACRQQVAQARMGNVEFLKCEEFAFPLEPGSVDRAFLAFVVQQTSDRPRFLRAVRELLTLGGWCTVLEWYRKETETGPPLEPRMDPSLLEETARVAGYRTRGWRDLNGEQYMMMLSPNPPKDTDGRREESGRGMRELQGK